MSINGSGALEINANYAHGIISKDNLIIAGGDITVNAVSNGIRGRDSLTILGGTFHITAGNDGLQSNNDEDSSLGYIIIEGGSFDITAECDAIQAQTALQIGGGTFELVTGDGSANASAHSEGGWGMWGNTQSATDTPSAKGLKADASIRVTGGTFSIDACDDALHTNGVATITGGPFSISTGDDGMHADSSLVVSGGEIDITQSYEGLEATYIEIQGGTIHVVASDDGVNSAGGNDSSSTGGRMGMDSFAATDGYIKITGGYLYVNAGGDGLDSNGALYIDGGVVLIDGPEDNGNGALDCNGELKVTGGILVAAGASGMAEVPGQTSTQYCIAANLSTQQGGTTFGVTDSSGNVIFTYTPKKSYSSVVFSLPSLESGETYTLYTGGQPQEEGTDSYSTGAYTDGTQLGTVTLDAIVTTFGTGGMGGMGGRGNMGGMGDKGGMNGGKQRP